MSKLETTLEVEEYLKQFFDIDYLKNNCGIYQILNTNNDKSYIGSTKNFYNRLLGHLSSLFENRHGNKKLQLAWLKHGKDSFVINILEICDENIRVEREQFYFDTYFFAQEYIETKGKNRRFSQLSYNLSPIAICNVIVDENGSFSRKISKAIMNKWKDEKFRKKILKIFSDPDYKERKSKIMKQVWADEDRRKRQSEIIKPTRTTEYNKKMSEIMNDCEMNKHLSDKSKALWNDENYVKKQEWTDEKRKKLSESVKRRWQDPEYLSKQQKLRKETDWAKKKNESNSKTRSAEGYSNRWFREVRAYDLETGELKMVFKNVKLANAWLKENRKQVKKGFTANVKVMLLEKKVDVFLGYRWEIDEPLKVKQSS